MKTLHKTSRFLLPLIALPLLTAGSHLFAQSGRGAAAEWPARVSGEFAFYRDYTFNDPAWTGVLFYDEGTWAVQVFFPESGKRVTSFFTAKGEGDTLVLTGQRNDPNLQEEDVPLVNYLMQILPLLWEARRDVEAQGALTPASPQGGAESLFPHGASLQKSASLFGGKCEFAFSPEIPLFSLKSVSDFAGRAVFAFESAGLITADDSSAFFAFEPVPQEAKRRLAETRKSPSSRSSSPSASGQAASEEILAVSPNFFLVGNTASVITGGGETAGLSPQAFYALAAKNFLLSGDASVLPVPETFARALGGNGVWLEQILYMKDEKELMRKRMLLQADFAAGKYSFAEVTCFESAFAENKERLEGIAESLLP